MNSKMLVSVIIPTYKRAQRLSESVISCLNQTYQNIEIIVVDDNNPDSEHRIETEKVMNEYSDNSKIKYIKMEKNSGGSFARNRGISEANGEYVAFLDDDDTFLPNKISDQLEFMITNKLDASFSNEIVYDENGKVLYKKTYDTFYAEDPLKYHLTKMIVGTQTFMYKRDVLNDIGGFDEAVSGQEYILMYKTLINGYKVGHLDKALVNIISHDDGRISNNPKKLVGEKRLYELKKKHFDILNYNQKRTVKYEWRANKYRFYSTRNKFKKIWSLVTLIVFHPIRVFSKILKKNIKE